MTHRISRARLTKRQFLSGGTGLIAGAALTPMLSHAADDEYDVIVVGGGNAGLPAAITAAQRGARVLIVEASAGLGGTLLLSGGRMSAAGTKLQKSLGIDDHPDIHFDDVMTLSEGTANPEMLRLAVDQAPIAFDWLMDNGFKPMDGLPALRGSNHAGQSRARYIWSEEAGVGILMVLEQVLAPLLASGQVVAQLETEVTALDLSAEGHVQGVIGRTPDGALQTWRGKNVVLTSGGYTANSELFAELEGALDYGDNSNPYSNGIGIELGLSVGGYLRGGEDHLPSFGGIPAGTEIPSPFLAGLDHHPENRLPWEIWVNAQGNRFIAEDTPSIHKKEIAMVAQSHERFWLIFDDSILRAAPSAVRNWSREDIESAFNVYPAFTSAESLDVLAQISGIDPTGLESTVRRYNAAQRDGEDWLDRKHMPKPIGDGPFYAIRVQSSQIISFAGLAVDQELRVMRSDQKPIPNLFAAGELLGAGQLMGRCYAGGMMVTPAVAFGLLLGRDIVPIGA